MCNARRAQSRSSDTGDQQNKRDCGTERRPILLGLQLACPAIACAVSLTGEVVGVADGDTITVLTADKSKHRIRIDGIDAPERTQPYSQRSKQSLSDMVHRQQVTAECSKIDRFGPKCASCRWAVAMLD